ncbi:OmpH family outer membrane protein [Massilia cavernae]|uniref:OmpH family outer membrane protein n=2 Tax=Massilia cavernae TaxID=2320864 RepID=A0A418Y5E7_9BURK|nr:OmpH family outer membrane protein [Massilia cavernae]
MSKHLLLLALVAAPAVHAQAQLAGSRVAYVATERLMTESKLAKAADAKIESEFSKRDKSINEQISNVRAMTEKFEQDAPKLSDIDRTRRTRELIDMEKDVQRKQREFREDLMQRKNEERANIAQKAFKIIEGIAAQENLDVVLYEAGWHNPRIDITDKILKQLDK